MDQGFDYREEFKKIDYDALKKDLNDLMTDSQSGGQQIMDTMGLFYSNDACGRDIQKY